MIINIGHIKGRFLLMRCTDVKSLFQQHVEGLQAERIFFFNVSAESFGWVIGSDAIRQVALRPLGTSDIGDFRGHLAAVSVIRKD